jgi:DNA-directed RNA polymerase specialized sigma24 family protein
MIEQTEQAITIAHRMNEAAVAGETLAVARQVRRLVELLPDVATACVEHGIHLGLSQKALADALGVPAATLRGAKQEFAR